MTYPDTVTVTRAASGPASPDPDSGWGVGPEPDVETVYSGPADVQDGQRTLRRLAEMGEAEDARAVVYFPPSGAAAFSRVRVGDRVQTPQGSGRVVALMQTDAALAVSVTESTPAVPEVLA